MKALLSNSGELTRRRFVSNAAKTLLGVSTLPASMMFGNSVLAAGKGASALKQVQTAKRVIYVYLSGGMSHLDTFDPKPGQEVMGPTRAIKTKTDGIQISEYLPRLARLSEKLAIIRSLSSTQGAHKQGNYMMHTSYELRSSIRHPAMGAWMLKFQKNDNPALPGNIMIGNDSQHPGAGFFESRLNPLMISDPEGGLKNSQRIKRLDEETFTRQISMAEKLDAGFVQKYDQKNVRAYSDMYDDALKLMQSKDLAAFDIKQEPEGLRERYGKDRFGQGMLLARRLAENGVRFVEVSLGGWDTHNANFVNLPEKAEELDQALSALLVDLERRGMLDSTLVVLATEFGRTPEINSNEGRDHHPQAFSCLLAGGGIRGGQVWGQTDQTGSKIVDGKITIPDFNATIAYALGLPLDHVLYSPSMRPFTVADKGKPLASLFG
tara:strand:- start:10988 stop:12295 length:1308 start_codon:yes stop_codon:yes gene_type:complete